MSSTTTQKHHKNVQVLGWNEATQNGSSTNSFTDLTAGQRIANTFITEGADIIFPVAGGVGLGAARRSRPPTRPAIT